MSAETGDELGVKTGPPSEQELKAVYEWWNDCYRFYLHAAAVAVDALRVREEAEKALDLAAKEYFRLKAKMRGPRT